MSLLVRPWLQEKFLAAHGVEKFGQQCPRSFFQPPVVMKVRGKFNTLVYTLLYRNWFGVK